jgi:hypothetical protein
MQAFCLPSTAKYSALDVSYLHYANLLDTQHANLADHFFLIPKILICNFFTYRRSCRIQSLIVERSFYFFLAPKGINLSAEADADFVTCTDDKNVAHFKKLVHEANKSTLNYAGVDSSKLEVWPYDVNGVKCRWNQKLKECGSGTEDTPFRIFYEGVPV